MKPKQALIRILSALLVMAMTAAAVSCAEAADEVEDTSSLTDAVTEEAETEEERDTRFDGINYDGKEFRVFSSVNDYDATNANALIAGSGETNGDIVNDAVYERNAAVEDLLGIKYVFIESDYDYGSVATSIRKLVTAGDDAYDLIINDLFAQASLTYEGMYVNVNSFENFDLTKSYWYKDYMEDLKILNDRMFIMAGDYFMDVIGSAHALFYNKPMLESIYGDPDALYEEVLQNTWTLDTMLEYVNNAYADINGDGKINDGDRMGFMCNGMWGSACPFIISADVQFIERDSDTGSIEFVFNNERSVKLLEKLNLLFHADGTETAPEDPSTDGLINHFGSEETLILGYNRIGYLEKMRDIEFDIGVIPYPKYDETQENYVTATHDTTEVGTIPITEPDSEFVSVVIEVSNRETQKYVVPAYYESALKIKYSRDETTAMMIDIIHDNFGRTFATAFNNSLGEFGLSTFTTNINANTNNFESTYTKSLKAATRALEKIVTKTEENTLP